MIKLKLKLTSGMWALYKDGELVCWVLKTVNAKWCFEIAYDKEFKSELYDSLFEGAYGFCQKTYSTELGTKSVELQFSILEHEDG